MQIKYDSYFSAEIYLMLEKRRGAIFSVHPVEKRIKVFRSVSTNGGTNRVKIDESVSYYKKENGYLNEYFITKLEYYELLKDEVRSLIKRP